MFQIRQCRPEDFDGIVDLLSQLWPEKSLEISSLQQVYEGGLAGEQQVYICATEGER